MNNALNVVVGLVVILLLFILIGWIVFTLTSNMSTALATAIGAVIVGIYVQYQTSRREMRSLRFPKLAEAYQILTDVFFNSASNNEKNAASKRKLTQDILKCKKILFIYASAHTIKAWNDFEKSSSNEENLLENVISAFENLMKRIRRDLGHHDWILNQMELSSFIIRGDEKDDFINKFKDHNSNQI